MIRVRWRFYEESLLIVNCTHAHSCVCVSLCTYMYVLCVRVHHMCISVCSGIPFIWTPKIGTLGLSKLPKQLWWIQKFVKPGHLAKGILALILLVIQIACWVSFRRFEHSTSCSESISLVDVAHITRQGMITWLTRLN